MNIPAEVKPACWGALGGAVVVALVGFTWGGWVTESTAQMAASDKAEAAVVAVLAPICADNFRRNDDAEMHLTELNDVKSWERGTFITKGGWATMPGKDAPESGVATACVNILTAKS